MDNPTESTLTPRLAAVQVKMLHLQFRMAKIYEDQKALSEREFADKRSRIRGLIPTAYSLVDMLVSFDHIADLMSDVFATSEIRCRLEKEHYEILNRTKRLAKKWRPVRNRVGGHIDIRTVENMCKRHGYRGVFLSDDLACDLAVLNMLLLESALNDARRTEDILGRDLEMVKDLPGETSVVVEAINTDWESVFAYFEPMMKLLYAAGKEEKMKSVPQEEWGGIVKHD